MNEKITTTTIKIENSIYDEFKTLNIRRKFYLKDLVIRSMYLYVNDPVFREKVYNFTVPTLSDLANTTPITIMSGSRLPTSDTSNTTKE
jgi:hypothetical protein